MFDASSEPVIYYKDGSYKNFTPTPTSESNKTKFYKTLDHMGNEVIFDTNAFGGTNNQNTISTTAKDTSIDDVPIVPINTSSNNTNNNTNNVVNTNNNVEQNVENARIARPTRPINNIPNIKITVPRPNKQTPEMVSGNTYISPDSALIDSTSTSVDSIDSVPTIQGGSINVNGTKDAGKAVKWYEQVFNPRSYAGAENLDQIAISGGRTRNDILVNDMIYSDFNRLPPSFNDRDFEYGYSFLPPKDWYPVPPYPPVCVSYQKADPKPVYLDTTTMDLKEWHETSKITPPDSINTAFIINELNSKV
jgi:hypothetical protein